MSIQWKFSFLFILIALAILSFKSYTNRIYDWDLPGYVGCLFSSQFPNSPEKVHNLTYSTIKKEASPLQYKDISGLLYANPDKGKAVQYFKKNAKAFSEQIAYYKIKVGYNWIISGIYALGFSAPKSVLLVSSISYFLSGILFFVILKTIFPKNYFLAVGITIAVFLLPTMQFMSQTPTPDMLGFFFMLLFILGFLKKWSERILFIILFLTILIRPDYIIFSLTYLFKVFLFKYFKDKKINFYLIFQGILLLGIYYFIVKYYSYPGWKSLFYDTFIQRRPLISAQAPNFTLQEYFDILYIKIINFKKVSLFAVLFLSLIFYISKDSWIRLFSVFIFSNIYLKFLFSRILQV